MKYLMNYLIKVMQYNFSPIIKTSEEAIRLSPLYLDMVEDAIIVYDRDGFFEQILENLREKLKKLGAERVWIGENGIGD